MTLNWQPGDEWDLVAFTPTHELFIGDYSTEGCGCDWGIVDRSTDTEIAHGVADNVAAAIAAAEAALALASLAA